MDAALTYLSQAMTGVEAISAVFGLVAVYLVTRQMIWCFPLGMVSVGLYVWVYAEARLYGDAGLHVVYFMLNAYGWWHWLYGGKAKDDLPVRSFGARGWVLTAIGTVIGTAALGAYLSTTDSSFPYRDAFTTVASLIAQALLARKVLENWHLWVIVNVVSIGIYGLSGLYITTVLYVIYLGLAVLGLVQWRRSMG